MEKTRCRNRACPALMLAQWMAENVVRRGGTGLEPSQYQHRTNGFVGPDEAGIARDDPARFEESLRVVNQGSSRAGDFAGREDVV
jgi:hypothetical protein